MLEGVKKIHLLGIGGIGVSGVARILHARGFEVSGSDVRESVLTEALRAEGVKVTIGHRAENVDGVDMVVVSTAIPATNLELVAAREKGIEIVHRSDVLNALIAGYRTIGVTGTHGKGTVSSMIAWIMECAGLKPGFIIGGMLNNFSTNARDTEGRWMVVEVDESDGSHQNIKVDYVVCNFMELDHLNYYGGLDDIIGTMVRYLEGNERLQEVFVNLDCAGNRDLVERVSLRPTGYAIEHKAEFRGDLSGLGQLPIRFEAFQSDVKLGDFELNLPGRYNVVNAMGAIAVARRIGIDSEVIAKALSTYKGMENRFTIARGGGVTIVKDYISHPTGIRKVIESAQDLVAGRLISVFKPYRYTLIKYLQDEYATAFQGSDEVIITTMYAANEPPIEGINTQLVVDKIRENGLKVTYIPEQAEINDYLLETLVPGDKVMFLGGDDFFRQADQLTAELARRAARTEARGEQPRMDGPLAEDGGEG